ncbi:MAG: BtaA family protein [Candidatus Calescibacterium sp.]|nr:BtaA family protein [Candidatus Calescibacterium sp.]
MDHYIHYSNCWEDTQILLKALNIKNDGKYLSILSAGDNTFSILLHKPSSVVGIDLNPTQIALTELKKNCIQKLEYEETIEFLGIKSSQKRILIFNKIKDFLSNESREFFTNNTHLIEKGIIHTGKFEKYFHFFRKYILKLFLNPNKIDNFMNNKQMREEFFYKKVQSPLGKMLFKVFFSNQIMGLLGRNRKFFKYASQNLAKEILNRIEAGLIFVETSNNPYLEYILKGNFVKNLPHYLQETNFYKLKQILNEHPEKLQIHKSTLMETLNNKNNIKFDGFNLSDVFEYMDKQEYTEHLQKIKQISNPKARIVYWNMLVDRNDQIEGIKTLEKLSNELFSNNQSFFYKKLLIQEVI